MRARLVAVLPLVLVALLSGAFSERWAWALAAAILAALPALTPRRLDVGPRGQLYLGVAASALGTWIALTFPLPPAALQGALGALAYPLTLGSLLFAISRRWFVEPIGGEGATLGIGLAGVLACGLRQIGVVYPIFVALYLIAAVIALRASDPGRAPTFALSPRHRAIAIAIAAGTALLAWGLALGLRPLYERAVNAIVLSEVRASTGFREGSMRLGSLAGMEQSDEVVLRVFGARGPLLLRGSVLREYRRGDWSEGEERLVPIGGAGALPPDAARVEIARDDLPRLFLPLAARRAIVDGDAIADAMGTLRRSPRGGPTRVLFEEGAREMLEPAPPGPDDLAIPDRPRPALAEIAAKWTRPDQDPAARLEALLAHLEADYVYSRTFNRSGRVDPTVDFLLNGKQGHCEYFASALALLARASGIPARVVNGYRASERSPLGYFIVRQRHAHAWVEAFVEGRGWLTLDPSPARSLEPEDPRETALAGAAWDWFSLLPARAADFVGARSLAEIFGYPLLLAGIAGLRRWWWSRARRDGRAATEEIDASPHVDALFGALADRGLARARSETLERFADRLEASAQAPLTIEMAKAIAALLRRHAAHRYGDVGDAAAIRDEALRLVGEVKRA